MNITILGAAGFIGSNLVHHFIEQEEHSVVGVDVADEKLEGIQGANFRFIQGDIHATDPAVYRDADVVIDLVAYANPSIYVQRPLDVFHTNFEANIQVLESCIEQKCRLLQFSTSEVYGKAVDPSGAYREDQTDLVYGPILKQRWIYAATKQLLERVIHAHGQRGDLEFSIVRPFNFLGPRFDYLVPAGSTGGPRVFAHFMSALLSGGPMLLVDGGMQRRSFTDIRDANTAVDAILEAGTSANGEVFNVGNPDNDVTILEFAEIMSRIYAELTGQEQYNEMRSMGGDEFYGDGYEDMSRQPPDVSKLRRLGWQPRYSLEETLQHAMRSYLDQEAPAKAETLTD